MMSTTNGRVVGRCAGVDPGTGGARMVKPEYSLPILLAERVRKAVAEAESFKTECAEMGRQANLLVDMIRAAVRRISTFSNPYERPAIRMAVEACKALERALSLARRCRRSGVVYRVVSITTGSAEFRKALALLEASLGDFRWLLSVYSFSDDSSDSGASAGGVGLVLSLPPIASTDPILSWVWSCIAVVRMDSRPSDRAEAAASLSNLAIDSGRNKKIIIEEGGVPPLLSLLRDDAASLDGQIAAATALANLAADRELVSLIVADLAVPVIVQVLADSPIRLQASLAALVARMAVHEPVAQDAFAQENAVRPLVSLLSLDVPLDDACLYSKKATNILPLVHNKRDATSSSSTPPDGKDISASREIHHAYYYYHQNHRKEWENEIPELKHQLKVACSKALWMLSRNCVSNSRKITETKGLLCLSKLIEKETGELQLNCLMTVREITAAAEFDADLRRCAFKTNSLAAKSVVEQLLRVSQDARSPMAQILAIKSVGSLARTFPARETRVLQPLVMQLENWNPDVATHAAVALGKFVCPRNFLRVEHSRTILKFEGLPRLMRLLRPGEKTQLPGLVLLCFLALLVPGNEALERAKAMGTLESVSRTSAVANHPFLKELLPQAIYQLELYRAGEHTCIHMETDSQ